MTELGERFFRHEHARLVARLARRAGAHRLESIEDAAQSALAAALEAWPRSGVPERPSAWLYRVALHHLAGELRRRARHGELDAMLASSEPINVEATEASLSAEVRDELLRMLFVCCDEAIPLESQLVLALKVLCGLGVGEIAERLFTTEANVYKRLARARERLRDSPSSVTDPGTELRPRLAGVQTILYALFAEGHLSSHVEGAIRRDLCEDAIRLAQLLAEHDVGQTPETYALIALMHLHLARLPARQDGSGGLLLLEEQDRSLWDRDHIATGLLWLSRSARGERFTRYHAEAAIAAEHCLAPSFRETRWERIVESYELLERVAPSSLHVLNRAVALAELRGPREGLALLAGLSPPSWLSGSYQWSAVLSDLHRRAGDLPAALAHREHALASAPSPVLRDALARRLA